MEICNGCGKKTEELYSDKGLCSECRKEYEEHITNLDKKLRGHQVKVHRERYETGGDIEDLK